MMRKILSLVVLSGVVVGCNASGGVDTAQLSGLIGEQNAYGVSALVRGANVVSIGPAQENAIGESVGMAITNRYPLVANDNLQRYVMLVGLTVANASSNPTAPWMFGVVESPEVNAFSGPNGYVFITRGALMQMRDEAELAGVLAHEVGHVIAHDGLEQVKAAEARGALGDVMRAGGSDVQQFSAVVDVGVEAVTNATYSQPQETKADAAAVRLMADAGYNPASYLAFLQRMQTAARGGGVMSTHPNIGARLQVVQQEMSKLPGRGGATLADRFAMNTRQR